jgi:hypothetical protein
MDIKKKVGSKPLNGKRKVLIPVTKKSKRGQAKISNPVASVQWGLRC